MHNRVVMGMRFLDERLRSRMRTTLQLDRALVIVWRSSPRFALANAAIVVVQGAFPLLVLYLIKLIVDAVTQALQTSGPEGSISEIVVLIALAGVASIAQAALVSVGKLLGDTQGQIVTDHMYNLIQSKSVEVDLEYYERANYRDRLHRAQREASFRPTRIVYGLLSLSQNFVSLLVMGGLMFTFHWAFVPFLCLAGAPGVYFRIRSARREYAWQRRRTKQERLAGYFNNVLTGDRFAKEVRLFNLGAMFLRRFHELRAKLRAEKFVIARERSVSEFLSESLALVVVYGALAYIAYRALAGAITIGDLVMFFGAVQRARDSLGQVLKSLSELYGHNLFLADLFEFLDEQPKIVDPAHPVAVPCPLRGGIEFDNVRFRYPAGHRDAVDGISLSIRPGEHIALVGENGSGKTTLVKLLCRLYDPSGGSITIDGIDLRRFEIAALRREIGVLFQDYCHYQQTARENISVGNIEAPPDEARIVTAAQRSGADSVIAELRSGYDTVLGTMFENGQELSIGQWQKIALARVFLRDAPIIVLDEPTSAIDARAEEQILTKFHEMTLGRTAVLISHRLSAVKMVDRIYVLDHGRIVETGSHTELMRLGGHYAQLFEIQARRYRMDPVHEPA